MADPRVTWQRLLARAVLGLVLAFPAVAVAGAPEGGDVVAWLARATDLKRSQVALVDADSVYSLEPLGAPLPTGEIIVLVRTEPLADDWHTATGFRSWDANLLIDCEQGRFRVIRSATYPERNRGGKPTPESQDYAAKTPLRTEPAARLLAAACDAHFAWPLRGSSPAAPRIMMLTGDVDGSDAATVVPRRWVLQVARGRSGEGARRAADAARKALGPSAKGLSGWTVATAETGDAQEHMGLLGVFPSYVAADGACQTLRQAKQDCLVRRDTPRPATGVTASPTPEVTRAATETAPPALAATYAVQIARGPSQDGARRALARARKALGPLAEALRDAMPVSRIPGDHLRYDARLEGFATPGAADEACRKLSSAGQDCFAREVSRAEPGADPQAS